MHRFFLISFFVVSLVLGSCLPSFSSKATSNYNTAPVIAKGSAEQKVLEQLSFADKGSLTNVVYFVDKVRKALRLGTEDLQFFTNPTNIEIRLLRPVSLHETYTKLPVDSKFTVTVSLEKVSPESKRFFIDVCRDQDLIAAEASDENSIKIQHLSPDDLEQLRAKLDRLRINSYLLISSIEKPINLSEEVISTLAANNVSLNDMIIYLLPAAPYNTSTKEEMDRPWLNILKPYTAPDYKSDSPDVFKVNETDELINDAK